MYADGWAHLNVGGLETFFTPWHGRLYGGFGLLVTWMAVMVWRRRPLVIRRVKPIPAGYGWGWVGVAVFAAGGVGDLVSTVLLVVPVLYLRRRRLLPPGSVTVLVGAVAIPAAIVSQLVFLIPAVAALAGAGVVDLILTIQPKLPDASLASLLPALVWTGQLLGLAGSGNLRWPPELWAGVVVLTALMAGILTWLMVPAPSGGTTGHSGQPAEHRTRDLSPARGPEQRAAQA